MVSFLLGKSKKSHRKKKEHGKLKKGETMPEKMEEAVHDGVYYISSGEEDSSKGMRSMNLKIGDVV